MADDSMDERLERIAAQVKATRQRVEARYPRSRTQRDIARLLARQDERIAQNEVRITQNEAMLRQLIEMQRRRNGGQTP
jgi:hypothetical protein